MIHVHVHTITHIYMHIRIQHIGTNAHRLKCYMHICTHAYLRSCMLQSCMTAYMYMHICIHALIHTWVSVCTRMSSYIHSNRSDVYIHTDLSEHMHVCIQACILTDMHAYKYVGKRKGWHKCIQANLQSLMHAHNTSEYMQPGLRTWTDVWSHICMNTHLHTSTSAFMHVGVHAHIHLCILAHMHGCE